MKQMSCLELSYACTKKETLTKFVSIRFLLLITCMTFTISVIRIQFMGKKYLSDCHLVQEAFIIVDRDVRDEVYRKPNGLAKELKYILLWSSGKLAPLNFLGNGQEQFIKNNCSHINCYVTSNKYLLNGDTSKFDAIAFNGRSIINKSQLPKNRSSYQKFIYFNMESADNFPVCYEHYDDFFNWTATYRLDSDISFSYIQIRDWTGKVIGPKRNMKWLDWGILNDKELEVRMQNKTKAVAWFASNCWSRSLREDYVTELQRALDSFGLSIDIYGECGSLQCPRLKKDVCFSLLEKEYYFYLSFENSFAEDYITEKVLNALQHNTVPIVLGGADYSRFLPPGSYINAGKMTPNDLALKIVWNMRNIKYYIQYFRWKSYYSYKDPTVTDNVCAVCEALNDKHKIKAIRTYRYFRKWWNPRYKYRCRL